MTPRPMRRRDAMTPADVALARKAAERPPSCLICGGRTESEPLARNERTGYRCRVCGAVQQERKPRV